MDNRTQLIKDEYFKLRTIEDVRYAISFSNKWLSKIKIYRQNSNNPSYYDEDIKKVQDEISKLEQLLIELENK